MLVDWFTFAAQVINFLILVWLLKKFLYRPILDAIDARDRAVAEKLAQAERANALAQVERGMYQKKNEQFAQERELLLGAARDEAQKERARLMEEGRREYDDQKRRLGELFAKEQAELEEEIALRTRDEVMATTRKALREMAGVELEARMLEVFLERLDKLDEGDRKLLSAGSLGRLTLRTACEHTPRQKAMAEERIRKAFGSEAEIIWEVDAKLVSGVELLADGHKLSWTLAGFISAMRKTLAGAAQ